VKTNRRERLADTTRKTVGRALGPLTATRHGWFYLSRRVVTRQMERLGTVGRAPGFAAIGIADVPSRRAGARVHLVHPASMTPIPPLRVHTDRDWVFRVAPPPKVLVTPPMHVLDVPGGLLFGSDGAVGTAIDELIVDLPTVFPLSTRQLERRADVARRLGRQELAGTTVSLLQHSIANYAHWLVQGVPRLELTRQVVDLATVDRVLVNDQSPPVVSAALDALGVPAGRVVPVPQPAPVFECERLVVATPTPDMAALPDWARDFLRALFLAPAGESAAPDRASEATGPQRLFVPRPRAARRRIVNAAEVARLLEARGFTTLAMEGRPVWEQAALFAGAEIIVAEHGAALANLAFAMPGTRVVELLGANTLTWMFAAISARGGLRHDVVVGIEPAPPPWLWSWQIDADQMVDVGRLARVIDGL
jgi:capsular polysaccharide biosynthesis protein